MVLFFVRVGPRPQVEPEFNDWHIVHMVRLASNPGYDSVRRYRALGEGVKYLALYEVQDEKVHELLGGDLEARHPNTYIDGPKFDNEILPHVDHFEYSFYRAVDGTDGNVVGDGPVAVLLIDPDEQSRPPVLEGLAALADDRRVSGVSLREAVHDPEVPPLGASPTPSLLALIQFADAAAAESFVDSPPGSVRELLDREAGELTAYGLAARLFPIPRDELFHREAGQTAKRALLTAIASGS